MSVAGRTAVVTGAARGIGAAYCRRLAADGVRVAAVDVADPRGVFEGLPDDVDRLAIVCDLTAADQVDAMVAQVLDRWERCDILVNNAGIFPTGGLDTVTLDTWRAVQAVNVEPALLLAQAFVPGMREAGWGRIVNTGSANTLLQNPDLAYMTSKGSLHALTRALANELGPDGITVNAIAPSIVATEGFLGRDRAAVTAEQVAERVAGMQTIKRAGVPSDLSDALAFLVSDDAGFITGQILHVDGGLTRTGA